MSIVTLRASAPTGYNAVLADTAVLTENPETNFARRWAAWQARGLAHDRERRSAPSAYISSVVLPPRQRVTPSSSMAWVVRQFAPEMTYGGRVASSHYPCRLPSLASAQRLQSPTI
jgi:hypothetical protein